MKLIPGQKVFVIATDEQLSTIGMTSKKINKNLRKYESIISDILAKGGFAVDEENPDKKYRSCVLDSTFVVPECWLELAENRSKSVVKKEENIKKEEKKDIEHTYEETNTGEPTTKEASNEEENKDNN